MFSFRERRLHTVLVVNRYGHSPFLCSFSLQSFPTANVNPNASQRD